MISLPLDGSGRNRPGAVATKGDLTFDYDFRDRLTRVTDGSGQEVASYSYDAFNRRLTKTVGGTTQETQWSGWRPLEDYTGGQLRERRIYGEGFDELVEVEVARDGDGTLETWYAPLYDASGDLAVVTDAAGKPLERTDTGTSEPVTITATQPITEGLVGVAAGVGGSEVHRTVSPADVRR